jgi:SAM-dependent methyltransferase
MRHHSGLVEPSPNGPGADDRAMPGPRTGRSVSFDRIADAYDATRGGAERAARHAALIAPHLDLALPVLDVGVGTGAVAVALHAFGFAVRGVDISLAMLRHARHRLGDVVVAADAGRLPFRDASVAQACSVWVLHLVSDIDAAVADVARCLAPGGRWVIVPAGGMPADTTDDVARIVLPLDRELCGTAHSGPRPSPARLSAAAARAGLAVETVAPLPALTYTEAAADTADKLERRVFSWCWQLDDDAHERLVAPVVAALRALPDATVPAERAGPAEVLVVLRRPERG